MSTTVVLIVAGSCGRTVVYSQSCMLLKAFPIWHQFTICQCV